MRIERFEELKSWQEARKLLQMVGRLIEKRSFRRNRGLSWQMDGAAISTMGNIAEAHGRYSFEDERRILDIAMGSCKEVQSHLYVALDRSYLGQDEFDEVYRQADVASQLLAGGLSHLDRQIGTRVGTKSGSRRKPASLRSDSDFSP